MRIGIVDSLVAKDISDISRPKCLCASIGFFNAGNRTGDFAKHIENCSIERFHSRMLILALNVDTDSTEILIIGDKLPRG